MTHRADRFRRIADRCRGIPGQLGLREHAVFLVQSSWDGASLGDGNETTVSTPIHVGRGQNPKVRFPSQREVALGLMGMGDLEIGPFTPKFGGGGVDRSTLNGSLLAPGDGLHVRVIGPQMPAPGSLFRIKNVNVDRALRVTMICKPAEA
jgi:hypothetical protein